VKEVRFQVLTRAIVKMSVFWHVVPCDFAEFNRLIALMMEAVSTSETSVEFYVTARYNISEDSRLQCGRSGYSSWANAMCSNETYSKVRVSK
jgi:hypothetical protein